MKRMTDINWRDMTPGQCAAVCRCNPFSDGPGTCAGCTVPMLYARLARYEDSGLDPEQLTGPRAAVVRRRKP